MKRSINALLTVLLAIALTTVVWADVLFEPRNSFFDRNSSQCVIVYRTFTVNTDVQSLLEPDGELREAFHAGQELFIYYTYNLDGRDWGLYMSDTYEDPEDDSYREPDGYWVPMDQLTLVYDYISFEEDYSDQFYPFTGSYDLFENGTRSVVLWEYPGAGEPLEWELEPSDWSMNDLTFERAYRDSQGREWGFWGERNNVWICLSNPSSRILTDNSYNPSTGTWIPPEQPRGLSLTAIAAILVVVLTAGTAMLIRVLWNPKSQDK